MNFVQKLFFVGYKSIILTIFRLFVILSISIYAVGCGDQVCLPSVSYLTEFDNAGPPQLTVDENRLAKAQIGGGPYRVAPNEVLELTMPAILRVVTADESVEVGTMAPYICRINKNGNLTLPVIGEIVVGGKTLAEVESAVIESYYPEYTVTRPSVFVRVLEYDTAKVSISGAVQKPGIYSLRRDQMSLVALLMEADGIIEEGAVLIRIMHREDTILPDIQKKSDGVSRDIKQREFEPIYPPVEAGYSIQTAEQSTFRRGYSGTEFKTSSIMRQQTMNKAPDGRISQKNDYHNDIGEQAKPVKTQDSESFVLPIKGLNIPFSDVALQDGDSVIVERLQIPLFTVIGLVNKPGNFEYPPDAKFNLVQALAFAGGLDQIAEPRYVTIYRLRADGIIVSAVFKLIDTGRGPSITDALNVQIKPGDIVSVEHTPRTRTNLFLERIFRINIGTYYNLNDAWQN